MQKILISLFILFFVNVAACQYYRPNDFVYNLGYSLSPLKLKWAIKLDSNYAYPYYNLAKYYQNKRKYLSKNGAIYYYCKFFEVNKRYPLKFFTSEERIKKVIEDKLISITSAYKQNPDFFKKDNKLSYFNKDELKKIVYDCVDDVEKYGLNNGFGGLSQIIFETYLLKAQLDFFNDDFKSYLTTCKVILNKTNNYNSKENKKFRLQVYDDMFIKLMAIGDTLSASQALNENLKDYNEGEQMNLDYQNKVKQLIGLLNNLNNISHNNYDICTLNGVKVFCRNKNVQIANYSSALKFWNTYFQENSIFFDIIKNEEYLKSIYLDNERHYNGFKYNYISILYDFYLKKGSELGMIWPLFGGFQQLSSKHFDNTYGILFDLIKTELSPIQNVYDFLIIESPSTISTTVSGDEIEWSSQDDILLSQTTGKCRYQLITGPRERFSDSVIVFDIQINYPETWKELLNIPIVFLDENKKIFTSKNGKALPTYVYFKKLYEIEKQKYENEQALIRARKLHQQEELKRLEQERLNRETQIRLIEEENERKQKEIDLVNAKNKQLENKHNIQNQTIENMFFWDKFLNSPSLTPSKKSSSHTCKWCSKTFSTYGFYYDTTITYKCDVRESSNSYYSEYCSRECAFKACKHKSR